MAPTQRAWIGILIAVLAAAPVAAGAEDPAEQVLPVRMDLGWGPDAPFCARAAEHVVYGRVTESKRLEVVRSLAQGLEEVSIRQPDFLTKTRFSRHTCRGPGALRAGELYLMFAFAHPNGDLYVHPRCVEVGPYDVLPADANAQLALLACWRRTTVRHIARLLETPDGAEIVVRCLAGVDYDAAPPAAVAALRRVLVEHGGRPEWMPRPGEPVRVRPPLPATAGAAGDHACEVSEHSAACAAHRLQRADALYQELRRSLVGLTERRLGGREMQRELESATATAKAALRLLAAVHEDAEQPVASRGAALVLAGQVWEVFYDKVGLLGINGWIWTPELFEGPLYTYYAAPGRRLHEKAESFYQAALALSSDGPDDPWVREARAGLGRLRVCEVRSRSPVQRREFGPRLGKHIRTLHAGLVHAVRTFGYPPHYER